MLKFGRTHLFKTAPYLTYGSRLIKEPGEEELNNFRKNWRDCRGRVGKEENIKHGQPSNFIQEQMQEVQKTFDLLKKKILSTWI